MRTTMTGRAKRAGLAVALLAGAGAAGADETTAGQTMALLGSARSAALTADTADGGAISGLGLNPAALAGQRRVAAAGTALAGLAGARVGQVTLAAPVRVGTVAVAVGGFDAGQVEMTDGSGATRTVAAQRDTVATAAFGRALAAGVEAGVAVTSFRSALAETYRARTWSVDLGARWKSRDGAMALGLAVARIGRGLAYADERVALPRTVRAGAAWRPVRRAGVGLLVAADYATAAAGPDALSAGAELTGLGVLAIRAGVTSSAGVATPGAGLGLTLGRMQFDYALTAPARLAPVSRATLTVTL